MGGLYAEKKNNNNNKKIVCQVLSTQDQGHSFLRRDQP